MTTIILCSPGGRVSDISECSLGIVKGRLRRRVHYFVSIDVKGLLIEFGRKIQNGGLYQMLLIDVQVPDPCKLLI